MTTSNIELLRKYIDIIDKEILALLDRRMELSLLISKEKKLKNIDILDLEREKYILDNLLLQKKEYITPEATIKIFQEILNNSVTILKNNNQK